LVSSFFRYIGYTLAVMINDLEFLDDDFRPLVNTLLDNCIKRGVLMVPSETIRSPFQQAIYWCQSRTVAEIDSVITNLKQQKADFLASCIEAAGVMEGPKITNALPGYSWHQWGEALDCYWQMDGKAIWDTEILINGTNGYEVYATEARKLKLEAGFYWTTIKDAVHVQFREAGSPLDLYTVEEINEIMKYNYT